MVKNEIADDNKYVISVRKIADVIEYNNIKDALDKGTYKDPSQEKSASDHFDALEYTNVRLKASVNEHDEGIIVISGLGSWVLVSIIEDIETNAFVSQYSEVEKVLVKFKKVLKEGEQPSDDDPYIDLSVTHELVDLKVGELTQVKVNNESFEAVTDKAKVNLSTDGLSVQNDSIDLLTTLQTFVDEVAKAIWCKGGLATYGNGCLVDVAGNTSALFAFCEVHGHSRSGIHPGILRQEPLVQGLPYDSDQPVISISVAICIVYKKGIGLSIQTHNFVVVERNVKRGSPGKIANLKIGRI